MKLVGALALGATLLAVTPATATVFNVSRTVGSGSVSGTITTDNTLGMLATGNITGFSLTLNDGTTTFTTANTNGAALIIGSALTATASGLFFNYSATSAAALFQSPSTGSGMDFFCFQGTSTNCADSTGVAGDLLKITGATLKTVQAGTQQVGTAVTAGVPEPATWAMMMLGFGGMGYAMRRRRSAETRIRFA